MNTWQITIYLLLASTQRAVATYFSYNGDANCTYPVTVSVNQVSCGAGDTASSSGDYCTFGDTMFISGEMTLEETLPSSEMCVTTKVCLFGYICRTYKETMDVCNAVGVSNEADGTACPNAGTFYFGSTAIIPGRPFMKLGSGTFRHWRCRSTIDSFLHGRDSLTAFDFLFQLYSYHLLLYFFSF